MRASPLVIGVALLAAILCAVWIGSMAGILPGAMKGKPQPQHADPLAADSHASAIDCHSCGTVSMIRTFELRDGMAPESTTENAGAARSPGQRFVYRVTVHMDDGSYRTFSQSAAPPFGVGAKVRVVNGVPTRRT